MAFFEPPTILIGVVLNPACQDCVRGSGGKPFVTLKNKSGTHWGAFMFFAKMTLD